MPPTKEGGAIPVNLGAGDPRQAWSVGCPATALALEREHEAEDPSVVSG